MEFSEKEAKIIERLKDLIDLNGPSYLTDEPYRVFKEMVDTKTATRRTAAALLHALVCNIPEDAAKSKSEQELSGKIKRKCSFNGAMSDRLAGIFFMLFSPENKDSWESRKGEGLAKFLAGESVFKWKGFSVWDEGNGTVECHYTAEIVLKPLESVRQDDGVIKLLAKNPFTTAEDICRYFSEKLEHYLDHIFDEYCTAEDYYPPVVEDFPIDSWVGSWGEKNGFELVSWDGRGEDSGYMAKYRRW